MNKPWSGRANELAQSLCPLDMLRRVSTRWFCTGTFPQFGGGGGGLPLEQRVGFDMIDAFAESLGISVNTLHCKALFGRGLVGEVPVLLAKPQTYMNLIGESSGSLGAYYKLPLSRVVVFHDDMNLPCGVLRLHDKGGHGSHNGLKNVIYHFRGNREFARLRIGQFKH
ncbi:hypothetical protein Syun_001762 [Stephania yunnanensis]|uniref:Peptidyl-tRNA hydrolase n=1 Tax=Stephania yunnanensis TaxID=152371 RepID=A0AAP0LGB3_9MAGN